MIYNLADELCRKQVTAEQGMYLPSPDDESLIASVEYQMGRMREYLYELTHRDDLVTAVLPIGDGITVSTKVK